jgi:hypothetical protein
LSTPGCATKEDTSKLFETIYGLTEQKKACIDVGDKQKGR